MYLINNVYNPNALGKKREHRI